MKMTDNNIPREENKGNDTESYKEASCTPIPNKLFKKLRRVLWEPTTAPQKIQFHNSVTSVGDQKSRVFSREN